MEPVPQSAASFSVTTPVVPETIPVVPQTTQVVPQTIRTRAVILDRAREHARGLSVFLSSCLSDDNVRRQEVLKRIEPILDAATRLIRARFRQKGPDTPDAGETFTAVAFLGIEIFERPRGTTQSSAP